MSTLITIQEFATSVYADIADQVDNIESIINQAEIHIQNELGRTFAVTSYDEIHYPRNTKIFLKERPITAVTSVQKRLRYDDAWETVSPSGLRTNNETGIVTSLEDNLQGYEVRVVYTAGYSIVPADIKAAVIYQTVVLAFQDFEVYGAGDGKEPAIKHLKVTIDELLCPYKQATLW